MIGPLVEVKVNLLSSFILKIGWIGVFLKDRMVKVWRAEDGVLCRTLSGHAHWVNTLALNVEYALRTSCFDPKNQCIAPDQIEEVCIAQAPRRLYLP